MDAATLQALGEEVVYVQWFAYMDIVGDPLRSVSGVQNIVFGASETGDPDLDGFTYEALTSDLIKIGEVQHSETGSQKVTASLSGLPLYNDDLLAILNDKPRWRKREARLWFRLLEPVEFAAAGHAIRFDPMPMQPYYSGYIIGMTLDTGSDDQIITVTIENYQAALSEGSGLTYLHQNEFDTGDNSASQTLASANGMAKAGVSGGGGGGGGGGSNRGVRQNQQAY